MRRGGDPHSPKINSCARHCCSRRRPSISYSGNFCPYLNLYFWNVGLLWIHLFFNWIFFLLSVESKVSFCREKSNKLLNLFTFLLKGFTKSTRPTNSWVKSLTGTIFSSTRHQIHRIGRRSVFTNGTSGSDPYSIESGSRRPWIRIRSYFLTH